VLLGGFRGTRSKTNGKTEHIEKTVERKKFPRARKRKSEE